MKEDSNMEQARLNNSAHDMTTAAAAAAARTKVKRQIIIYI